MAILLSRLELFRKCLLITPGLELFRILLTDDLELFWEPINSRFRTIARTLKFSPAPTPLHASHSAPPNPLISSTKNNPKRMQEQGDRIADSEEGKDGRKHVGITGKRGTIER